MTKREATIHTYGWIVAELRCLRGDEMLGLWTEEGPKNQKLPDDACNFIDEILLTQIRMYENRLKRLGASL